MPLEKKTLKLSGKMRTIDISHDILEEEKEISKRINKTLGQMAGIDPVVDDRHANSHDADNYFRDAVAVVVLCDFDGLHSAHECKIPVPLHDADVEYFTRMEPVVRQFYIGIVPRVRAVRLVSVVLEVTLNDGSRSYHAIQPR